MKHFVKITIAALTLCCTNVKGQIIGGPGEATPLKAIYFAYDAAGNRINRSTTLTAGPVTKDDDDDELTTSSSELIEEENTPDFGSQAREIHVYPNPVREELMIEIWNGEEQEAYRLKLFDMTGKLVMERKIEGNGTQQVDFNSYPSGTYLLIINADKEKFQFKIIKEN
jgi:hypothetical protein